MKTRINKYYDDTPNIPPRRIKKNNELYEEIKKSELENFDIGSNAKVIGENDSQIDIDKLKDILEKNYQEVPKRRSLKLDLPEEEERRRGYYRQDGRREEEERRTVLNPCKTATATGRSGTILTNSHQKTKKARHNRAFSLPWWS